MVLKQFRRHKAGGSDKFSGLIRLRIDDNALRQTEVRNLRHTLMSQNDIVRLQIAMQNSRRMGCRQPFGDSQCQSRRSHRCLCPIFLDQFPERPPGDEFHLDEVVASFFANGMNGDDIGMIQRGSCLPLVHEPCDVRRITFRQCWRKNFESTFSPEIAMPGEVNTAHRPCPEQCFDIVDPKLFTDQLVDFDRLGGFRSRTICRSVRVLSFMKNRISETVDFRFQQLTATGACL